jgi:hypothetical protein
MRSAYHLGKELIALASGQGSESNKEKGVWKFIWSMRVPNQVKMFSWSVCLNILPTRSNLAKRKVVEDSLCPCCKREPKTTLHVLWNCLAAQDVWGGRGKRKSYFQKCRIEFVNFEALLEEFIHRFDKDIVEFMVVLARQIWLRRNSYVFEGEFRHPNAVFDGVARALEEYKRCLQLDRELVDKEKEVTKVTEKKWTPPLEGKIKINWDAAVNAKGNCIGLGIVARDCSGMFLGAKCIRKPIFVKPKMVEAMAALWAVLFCKEVGFFEVVFEGDSAQVVGEILSNPTYLSSSGHLIESIVKELNCFRSASFVHVTRECNIVAHTLAMEAVEHYEEMYWIEETPNCIGSFICRKCIGP